MSPGDEGLLTLTVKMKVSPEPDSCQELLDLMKKYKDALNYSIRAIIEREALSLSKVHKLLYSDLKEKYNLPSRIAVDCYRSFGNGKIVAGKSKQRRNTESKEIKDLAGR